LLKVELSTINQS